MLKDFIKKTHQHLQALKGKMEQMKRSHKAEEEKFMEYGSQAEKKAPQIMRLEIPTAVIAKVFFIALLFIAGVAFVSEIRGIILIFFVSLLFAAALDPFVDYLQKRRIPRWLGVVIVYVVIFIIIGAFVGNLIPLVAKELGDLAMKIQDFLTNIANGNVKLPTFLEGFRPAIKEIFEGLDVSKLGNYRDILLQTAQRLTDVGKNVVNVLIVTFNGLMNTVLVFVLTFLMTVDERSIDKFILSMFPTRYGRYITEKSAAIKEKIGYWLRGQVALMFAVGILAYVGFLIIGLFTTKVEYATTLAMLAGITEVVPVVGPVLAWLISVPIVANQSLMLVVWVTILYIVVQQLENNLIVPAVMNKAVGLNPVFVILAVLIGYEFLGILGMVIAVPVATTVAIFVKDYVEREK